MKKNSGDNKKGEEKKEKVIEFLSVNTIHGKRSIRYNDFRYAKEIRTDSHYDECFDVNVYNINFINTALIGEEEMILSFYSENERDVVFSKMMEIAKTKNKIFIDINKNDNA